MREIIEGFFFRQLKGATENTASAYSPTARRACCSTPHLRHIALAPQLEVARSRRNPRKFQKRGYEIS
jgi:hypothetical protein